jgi:Serine hydrolase
MWGSQFFDAGPCGHINVTAGFGSWPDGEDILAMLIREIALERRFSRRFTRRHAHAAWA